MFTVGQRWRYPVPEDLAQSRLIIGAILVFEGATRLICTCVTHALQTGPTGDITIVTIPFLPMTEAALAATVTDLDGDGEVAPEFAAQFQAWHEDGRGLSYFTVPFEGSLDRMIARQMADIADASMAGNS
ncbi:MAG: hypothetical protein ACKVP7_15275 [Hyphomicrobiaceae bacterium]